MLNLLVIENDPSMCKKIVNGVMLYVKNVRVCGISYTVKEAIEIASKQKVDIVILDYDLPNGVSHNFLNFVSEHKEKQNICIILLTDNQNSLDDVGDAIICNPHELTKLIYSVRNISNSKVIANQGIIKNKIFNELEKLQYNLSYVGTQYMAEAIYEIYSKKYIYTGGNLTKNVFPVIAEKHHTNINNVKCNITQATRCMIQNCPKEMLESYLFCVDNNKPRVKEIMYKIINKL